MKGLDTNVIVAWLLDAPGSADLPASPPLRISLDVLAELVWVFDRSYKRSRAEIAAIVDLLLGTEGIRFDSDTVVAAALEDFRAGAADFADYLLMRDGKRAGCETTLTFDRQAVRHHGYTLLQMT